MTIRILLFCIFFVLFSCTEDAITENMLVEIKIDESYFPSIVTAWAFASDQSGEILSSAQLTNGSTIILKSSSDVSELSLSVFTINNKADGIQEGYSAITYSNIPVKSQIRFSPATNDGWGSLPTLGTANIDIMGENLVSYNLFLSSRNSVFIGINTPINGGIRFPVSLRSNPENIFISGYRNFEPVFKWVNGVSPNQTVSVDVKDLMPFSKTTEIDVDAQTYFSLWGTNAGSAPIFISTTNRFASGKIKFGILDGFDTYTFHLYRSFNRGSFTHFKTSPLANFSPKTFPNLELSVTDSKVNSFQFSLSAIPTYTEHYWSIRYSAEKSMNWVVIAPETKFPKLEMVASAVRDKYPGFDIAALLHIRSMAIFRLDDFSYSDYIKQRTEAIHKPAQEYMYRNFDFY